MGSVVLARSRAVAGFAAAMSLLTDVAAAFRALKGGFFLWPTLIDHTTSAMRSYQEEIFGPVLQLVRAETFEEALSYPSSHHQGNAVSIFTRSGDAAQRFVDQVAVGMVGVNFPMPVPVSYHSFGGWKDSAFGDLNQYGEDSIRFFTRTKIVTQRWPSENTGVR
jgi:malonate-semialdehyde dehydrogenase (acetylating)/methylmalonate-semialdehyde dehydrogenase